ncbi:aminotransferase-like domain-containing protein [Azohydromonas caseinilytica]|uniref:PLP-dependent aminotransferase family protein n=1 Tax=Azohydromonas caseinilytica TaxID=2728836 RepID=A0A848FEY3_9BURK|nr:PLP-dependent aminotransferase family protein [Azohydromonas caseinilytica]NML17646.1 PLP-dependent aminotransferase family protein [Azohydromonas caseinilytica]
MDRAPDTLYLHLADQLAGSIRAGTLARGERLASVRELARQRGVSVSTVVQAYRTLEDARLIEARPRSGYFVAGRAGRRPAEPDTTPLPAQAQLVAVSSLAAKVMALANDPDVLSFGAVCPDAELFQQERVRRAVSRAAQRHRASLCRYPSGSGALEFRRAVARQALALGCQLDPERIVSTTGCQAAISLCLRAVTQPGDVVALESPTSFGFLELLESLHLRALEIPTHPRQGMSVDALSLALDTQPVKAVLAVPTLSNPLGSCMPVGERRRLAQLVAQRGVPLIEDVIYNPLCGPEHRRAVRSFDGSGHVMLCGSYSKTMTPGVRVGYVEAGRWTPEVRRLKTVHSGSFTELMELALADLLLQPGLESGFRQLRTAVAARVDEARGIVAESFPKGTRVTDPPGGFILWVELPPGSDAMALFEACLCERICIAPGAIFSTTGRYRHCLRLGLGGRWDEAQRRALRRVGELAHRVLPEAVSTG